MLKEFNEKDYIGKFDKQRGVTIDLIKTLTVDDMNIQTEEFVSPTKWHLAHTTWFFEKVILEKFSKNYISYNKKYTDIFNSYYQSYGNPLPRNKRKLLSRPSVEEILDYRKEINKRILNLLNTKVIKNNKFIFLLNVGINHEQQHQELILMDILNVFFNNPLKPLFNKTVKSKFSKKNHKLNEEFFFFENINFNTIGSVNDEFCFDNELPAFKIQIRPFEISRSCVTNLQWKEFIKSGGYNNSKIWLSDGFDFIKKKKINKPMYWLDENYYFSLNGVRKIIDDSPVTNISFYEADAYARWRGKRLPTEIELEALLGRQKVQGNFLNKKIFEPLNLFDDGDVKNLFGNVWEWTSSAYLPYQSYKPWEDELAEYNGKFMCNQIVLKGGSCFTPHSHIRSSYRNFFYPSDRWACNGFRLASKS